MRLFVVTSIYLICLSLAPLLRADEARLESLSQEVSRYASRVLGASGNRVESEVDQWAEAVKADELAAALLDHMEPTDQQNSTLMAKYAYACEVLGYHERAIDYYQRVLAIRSKYGAVRLRLFPLLAESDFDKAVALLPDLGVKEAQQLGSFLRGYLTEDRVSFEKRLQRYRLLNAYLGQVETVSKINLNWVASAVDQLANEMSSDEIRLPSLYKVKKDEQVEAVANLMEQQEKLHTTLCHTLLKLPQLARDAFRRLAPFVEDQNQLAELAVSALEAQSRDAVMRRKDEVQNPLWLRMLTPEEFLVRYVWKNDREEWFQNEAIPAVEKASVEMANELKAYLELYHCGGEDFVEKAQAFQKAMAGAQESLEDQAFARVVMAWNERELDVDLWPLIVDQVETWKRERRGFVPDAFAEYANGIRRVSGVQKLLWQLTEAYVGPRDLLSERWEILQKDARLPLEVQQYLLVVKRLSRETELLFDVLDFFDLAINPYVRDDTFRDMAIDLTSHPLFTASTYHDIQTFSRHLEETPFLNDLDQFRMYARQDGSGSVFLSILSLIIQSGLSADGKLEEIRQYLNSKPPTFGRDMLVSALAEGRPDLQVAALLAQRREALEQLSVKRQLELTLYLDAVISEGNDLSEYPENSREVVLWLRGLKSENVQAELEAILAATSFKDVAYDDVQVLSRGRDLLRILVQADDQERARELFWKLMGLIDEARESGRWNQEDTGSATFGGELLTRMMAGSSDIKALNFVLSIIATPGEKVIERSNPLHFQLPIKVLAPQTTADGEVAGPITRLKLLYEGLGNGLHNDILPLGFDGMCDVLHSIAGGEEEKIASMMSWLESEGSKGDHPEVAKVLLMCGRLNQHVLNRAKRTQHEEAITKNKNAAEGEKIPEVVPAEVPALEDSLNAVVTHLESNGMSLTGRLAFMESVLSRFQDLMDSRVASLSAGLVLEAWEHSIPMPDSQVDEVVGLLLSKRDYSAWSDDVRAFVSSWRERRLLDMSYAKSTDLCRKMLELSLAVIDLETVKAILAEKRAAVDFAWLRLLIRYEAFSDAESIIKELWRQLDWTSDRALVGRLSYDDETAAAVETFASEISEKEWSLLLRSWFAALPDDGTEEDASERDARLSKLAGEIDEAEIEDPDLLTAILATLAEAPKAARELNSKFEKVGSGIHYTDLLKVRDHGERHRKQRVVTTYLRQSLSKGSQVIDERVALLRESRLANERSFAARLLCEGLDVAFTQDWHLWTQEVLLSNLTAWRALLEGAEAQTFSSQELKRWYVVIGVMHAIAGDHAGFSDWTASLPEMLTEVVVGVERQIILELFIVLESAMQSDKLDKEMRLAALESIYKDPTFNALAEGDPAFLSDYLTRFANERLLSREEFETVAPQWVEANPRNGWAWHELALYLSSADKNEEAVASWDKAIALIGDDDERYSCFQLGKATHLVKVKNLRDARKVLNEFDRERLHEKYEEHFNRLEQELAPKPLNPEDVV